MHRRSKFTWWICEGPFFRAFQSLQLSTLPWYFTLPSLPHSTCPKSPSPKPAPLQTPPQVLRPFPLSYQQMLLQHSSELLQSALISLARPRWSERDYGTAFALACSCACGYGCVAGKFGEGSCSSKGGEGCEEGELHDCVQEVVRWWNFEMMKKKRFGGGLFVGFI